MKIQNGHLAHHGIPNMHWGEHREDVSQQPIDRYAKGVMTKGISVPPASDIVKDGIVNLLHLNPDIGKLLDSSLELYGRAKTAAQNRGAKSQSNAPKKSLLNPVYAVLQAKGLTDEAIYQYVQKYGAVDSLPKNTKKQQSGENWLPQMAAYRKERNPTANPAVNLIANATRGISSAVTNYINSPNGKRNVDAAKASTFNWFMKTANNSRGSRGGKSTTMTTTGRPTRL